MKKLKRMLPYFAIMILDFYLLPFLIKDTGSAMILLLAIIPLVCFCCAVFFGIKNSFHWLYSVIVAILFIPSIFIMYNTSAWVYIPIFGITALIGNLTGSYLGKRIQ